MSEATYSPVIVCPKCRGKGTVLVDIRRFRFGLGFRMWMDVACAQVKTDSGETFHELVCPQCDGAGELNTVGS